MTDELTDELTEDFISPGSAFAYASLCRTSLLYSRVYTNRTTLLASLAVGWASGLKGEMLLGIHPRLPARMTC